MTTQTVAEMGSTTTDDEFLALILADPQLLEAEFAEIVADPRLCPPPPVNPRTVGGSDHQNCHGPMRAPATRTGRTKPVIRASGLGTEPWNRQRSPPQNRPARRHATTRRTW